MKYKFISAVIFTLLFGVVSAQFGGRGAGGMGGGMPSGRFYGKIVDSKTNKPVEAVSVELVTTKFNMATKQRKDSVLNGQLTAANGDFSLDNIPFMGDYRLRITAVGFKPMEQKVSFLTADQQQKVMQLFMSMNAPKTDSTQKKPAGNANMMDGLKKIFGGDMSQMVGMADKDLGNIKLVIEAQDLQNVTVVGNKNAFTMSIDRKVFDATKAVGTAGQTALEVMKQVPSLNVDIDGNVTLRNASPTIFVDGRPTTLTLDQIPADNIQSVEVITNPSAKFDASGGTASILNIVLKKNKKTGYNGNLRAGIDQRGKINAGGDFNLRQQKVNIFVSGQYGERKSISDSKVDNNYYATSTAPVVYIGQNIRNTTTGTFAFLRGGFDYFMDNRNTLTIAGTIVRGKFDGYQSNNQINDSMFSSIKTVPSNIITSNEGIFHNNGGTLSFKHNFAKTGHEVTADVNYNHSNSNNNSDIINNIYNSTGSILLPRPLHQQTNGTSISDLLVIQSDYSNPISADNKFEAGVRAQIRDFTSTNFNSAYNYDSAKFISNAFLNSNYKFTDQVYAAYATYTGKVGKLGYNVGLRAESSNYNGTKLSTKDSSFSVKYPISLFPSAFISYKLNDKQDIQLNYTRRINRPNFFQLLPFVNYTDPLNLSVGNPALTPEFTNSLEANYSLQIDNNNSILVSTYYKYTTDLITRSYDTITNPFTKTQANLISYVNASSSTNYGLEVTSRNNITPRFDVTTNLNFYNSSINASNVSGGGTNSRTSFFGKMNTNYRIGKTSSWTLQLNGDFQGKTVVPVSGSGGNGGGRGGGGGSFFMGGGNQSAGTNGYVNQSWGVDAALKKEFLKNKVASITLSVNDIFKTRIRDTYTYTTAYTQNYNSRRDQQIFRLQFSYRFGKQDVSLFKRKNLKGEMEGVQDANSGQQ